jgi:hypothetical protein
MGKPGGLHANWEGDEITQGKAVKFEIGVDPKSGKSKAVSVDLVWDRAGSIAPTRKIVD